MRGSRTGSGWAELDFVFCRIDGQPLHPERVTRQFIERTRQLGLPRIRLHDLRHGWATLALAAGVHPKVVQERLGHANIGITRTFTRMSRRVSTGKQPSRWPR